MKTSLKMMVAACLITSLQVASSWAATTVKGSKSNSDNRLSSNLVTASTPLSGPSNTRTVYQTPASGDFTLTQFCVSPLASGGIRLNAGSLGTIAHLGVGGDSCQTFSPGIVLPPDTAVTCSTSSLASRGSYFCTIAGLLAPPPTPAP